MTEEEKDAYIKKLLTSNIDQHNNISFLSTKVQVLQKLNGELTDKVKKLEAEVKEWKDKAELWCKTANLKDHNIMINKELEKENEELKEELKKWKDEWQEQVQKATDEGYARTLQTIQLTKAKELLKEFVHHYKDKTIYIENMQDLLEQVERFIKDSEVEK